MSAAALEVDLCDGVMILTLADRQAAALGPTLRADLLHKLSGATGACKAIVIRGAGSALSGALPLDPDHARPDLSLLCQAVAECSVPVVATLQGLVTGPMAELALAAQVRLADASLRLAFADVALGLSPAAGASQRLPHLIGARAALDLLVSGRTVAASEALSLGLIDRLARADLFVASLDLALAVASGKPVSRARPDPVAWQSAVTAARRDLGRRLPAGQRIVDCVEAALLLPAENALAFETVARRDLEATPEAAGLRSAAMAERHAMALPPGLATMRPGPVAALGLMGNAPDLSRLAVAALSRDLDVVWAFPTDTDRRAGLAAVDAAMGAGQRAGRLTIARARAMMARLQTGLGPDGVSALSLIVHDRPPERVTQQTTDLGRGRPDAAHLVLGGAAGAMGLGLLPSGRACEVSLPVETAPLSQATALAGLRRIGLLPVIVGPRPVVGARMADAGRRALADMIASGVPQRLVAATLEGFGLRLADAVLTETPAPLRAMSATEVLQRWLAALANEGARLLETGLALRPLDIDFLMVAGQGFPRWQGGPMYQADRRGLMVLRADLRQWATEACDTKAPAAKLSVHDPAPLIDRLIRDGGSFAALNAAPP